MRISLANQKDNMFNIMDWMPKVQDKADPKKKKVRKKKSEKL